MTNSKCDPKCVDGYCVLTNSSACRLSDAALKKPEPESYIKSGKGGTLLAGADAVAMFRAATIASALSLYAKTGIIPNRMWTPTRMLEAATGITGKKYKRGQHAQAAADVKAWAEEMKAALPHIVEE